jgi:hypothetical protein
VDGRIQAGRTVRQLPTSRRALSVTLAIAQALGPNSSSFLPLNSWSRVCSVTCDEVLICAQILGAPQERTTRTGETRGARGRSTEV